jgi:DNA polymerase V
VSFIYLPRLDFLPAVAFHIIEIFKPEFGRKVFISLYQSVVAAGFPSPADDFLDKKLDLNEYLIRNADATFYVRVKGNSMQGCGIYDGAILIVDRSEKPRDGDVVLGVIHGEFTCKRIRRERSADGSFRVWLQPENPDFPEIPITEEMNFRVWGVVISAINDFRRK